MHSPAPSHICALPSSFHNAHVRSCTFTCLRGCLVHAPHLRRLPCISGLPPSTSLPPAAPAFTMRSSLFRWNSAAKLTHNLWVAFNWCRGTLRTLLALHPNASQLNGLSILHRISNGIIQPTHFARVATNVSAALQCHSRNFNGTQRCYFFMKIS